MTEPTLDTLTQRLDRMERENRRWKLAGGLASLVVLALAVMGQVVPRTRSVDAEEFILQDQAGKRRAVLGVKGGGAHLALYDGQDVLRLLLALGPNGTPTITLADHRGRIRTQLELQEDGLARFVMPDEKGTPAAVVGVNSHGAPWIGLTDNPNGFRAMLGVGANRLTELALFDSAGKSRLNVGVRPDGSPFMLLTDEKGRPRVGISAFQGQDGSIGLLDGGGKMLWKAP